MVDHKNIRRCRRLYSLHNSYTAISIRDLKRARKLKRLLVICAMAIQQIDEDADEDEDNDGDIEDLQDIFRVILFRRRRLIYEGPHIPHRQRDFIPRSIESFRTTDIANLFRFRSHIDMRRVLALWDLLINDAGEVLISKRGHYMFPEELFYRRYVDCPP